MSALLLRPAWARLTRVPGVWLPLSAWAVLALTLASWARMHFAARGADAVLLGGWSSLALPLLAYAVVGCVARDGLGAAARPLVALGVSPTRAAGASVLVAVLFSAGVCAVLGGAVVAIAGSERPMLVDALTTAWVSGLAAAAYASLFALGATFGTRGSGRSVVLIVDWIVGDGHGTLGFLTPRAHLRSLLGGTPLDRASQGLSITVLAALIVMLGALATHRARTSR